ncbi:hypothetical protein V491_03451, partial [Pseudogymnoascus sp. VKM F-3775]
MGSDAVAAVGLSKNEAGITKDSDNSNDAPERIERLTTRDDSATLGTATSGATKAEGE